MIDQDNILLILNCKKYRTKALYQKETWLKNIPIDLLYFHVIGEKTMDSVYKFDHQNKILWVRVEDDYISLPKKVITAYHAVSCEYNFKFIVGKYILKIIYC